MTFTLEIKTRNQQFKKNKTDFLGSEMPSFSNC